MVKIVFMGGQWTNKEDRILEAGISKYGLNNWHRVSSLLQRKTAEQCKERWTQYLDPTLLKKKEWTKEEEEKLIFLQKLFPERWQTIAKQLPGRTGWMCEEHYAEMLDLLGGKGGQTGTATAAAATSSGASATGTATGDGSTASTAAAAEGTPAADPAFRDLRRDYFSQQFETRDAKADQVDDDQQDDMLTVARARLANQYGKKGLRRQRKALQEDANVLASLQRAREMQASGTMSHTLKKKIENALKEDAEGRAKLKRPREEEDDLEEGDEDINDDDDDDDDAINSFIGKDVLQNPVAQRRKKRVDPHASSVMAASDGLVLNIRESAEDLERKQNAKLGVTSGVDLGSLFVVSSETEPSKKPAVAAGNTLINWDDILGPSTTTTTTPHHGIPQPLSSPSLRAQHQQDQEGRSSTPSSPHATAAAAKRSPSVTSIASPQQQKQASPSLQQQQQDPTLTDEQQQEEVEEVEGSAAYVAALLTERQEEDMEKENDYLSLAREAVQRELHVLFHQEGTAPLSQEDDLWLTRAKAMSSHAFTFLYADIVAAATTIPFPSPSEDEIKMDANVLLQPSMEQLQSDVEALRKQFQVPTTTSSSSVSNNYNNSTMVGAVQRWELASLQKQFYEMVEKKENEATIGIVDRRARKLQKEKERLLKKQSQLKGEVEEMQRLLDQGVSVIVGKC